jgi:hypothetical protein
MFAAAASTPPATLLPCLWSLESISAGDGIGDGGRFSVCAACWALRAATGPCKSVRSKPGGVGGSPVCK